MWAAPNEPEGPGGIRSDGRSAYETETVRAPQKLEVRNEATVCLNDCIFSKSAIYLEFRGCMVRCMSSEKTEPSVSVSKNTKMKRHDDHY